MARPKRDTRRIDCNLLLAPWVFLDSKMRDWGYTTVSKGVVVPWWGGLLEAIASGIIAEDEDSVIIQIPKRKP